MDKSNKNYEILNAVCLYMNKHVLAKEIGSEYVSQDDLAQIDAIDLVCELANIYCKYREKD